MSVDCSSLRKIQDVDFEQADQVWIFGKGPSLETHDKSQVGRIKVCINESVQLVENPTFFFAHDETPIKNVANDFPENCVAILEPSRAEFAVQCGIPAEQIAIYDKHDLVGEIGKHQSLELIQSGKLIGKTGTVHSAIHFCQCLDAKTIKLVGFEGQGDYAASLNMEVPLGGGRHDLIRKDSERILRWLGFDFEFVSKNSALSNARGTVDYAGLYDSLRNHGYHEDEDHTSHIAEHIDWIIKTLNPASVLDIGCSAGASVELFQQRGIDACGIDISQIAIEKGKRHGRKNLYCGCATQLPFEDGEFDAVVSADVFEHLAPEDGPKACAEACRVARRFVFLKIAEREDATRQWKEIAGHPLHLTTQSIEWWKNHLMPFGRVKRLEPELICIEIN